MEAGVSRVGALSLAHPEDQLLKHLHQILSIAIKSDKYTTDYFISLLTKFLLNRQYSVVIAKCFPRLVLQIVCENISLENEKQFDSSNNDIVKVHVENCLLLGKLVLVHPDVMQFSLQYFDTHPSPFESAPTNSKSTNSNYLDKFSKIELVECCFNFLKAAPNIFRIKWNWSKFIKIFIDNSDVDVQWFTSQCLIIIFGMSEYQSEQFNTHRIGKSKSAVEHYFTNEKYERHQIHDEFNQDNTDTGILEELPIKSDHIVNVSGVLLPTYNVSHKQDGVLVLVKSTIDNLRSLALAVVSGKAACLVGPVGSGKTALVEHLAYVTGRYKNHFKKVQLGDQTDSRSLLGTYRCTDIPGEFIWQPGILTQAVQQGHWLLMEDIDCAATDIASVLSSLLERNVLSVPGYRDALPITPGFQLFFTQRTVNTVSGYHKPHSNSSVLLQKHWAQINVEPLSRLELINIVEQLFPKLKTISTKMVDVFMLFSAGSHGSSLQNSSFCNKVQSPLLTAFSIEFSDFLSSKGGRLISTRDLIKWCYRATIDFDVSSQESALKVLQDAMDIFTCSLPEQSSRILLSKAIGAILGIIESKSDYYCTSYKPLISMNANSFHIGRAIIPRKEVPISETNLNAKKVTFSFTRPSTCLLERIASCVSMKEPVLLVGETGTGKTSSIQYLAKETGHKLLVINMNQQSDSADLLGGYKPVDVKYIISPIRNEFEYLFRNYFDDAKNAKFLEYISVCFNAADWKTLLTLMKQSQAAAIRRLESDDFDISKSRKRKLDETKPFINKRVLKNEWHKFGQKLSKLELQIKSQSSLAFSFIEGSLVKALKEGYWVLLDEINLASAETLECLSGLLENHNNSISLLERGDNFFIKRNKEFKLFACMNPATDVGKRDLPVGLRNRFTEFYVDELTDRNDLLLLIGDYLKDLSLPPSIYESIYKFYITIGKEAKLNLMDGTGQSPHYSLRTLCRALSAALNANCGTVSRSLYETMCLSFLTQLDSNSHPMVQFMIAAAVLGKKSLKSVLQQPIPQPKGTKLEQFLSFEGYWICKGTLESVIPDDYILTSSVRKNLKDLVRIISLGKLPILLQGDTSVGKTSLITYLAKASGNHCVRINNHQHTDIQEYVGSYATDSSGKLIFREGVLVEAMRKGYWIILDELNLAPSDVLEALNRVLDDNKELFIPETQQVVKANPKFMLFATQNPPGLYGGRNLLSRAFRNRFVELHFDEIPRSELEVILHQRCHMPLSYCKKVLSVMAELQVRRRGSAAVQGKEGFITLRDLFRWGQRYKVASNHDTLLGKYYDWDQHIADEGYLVLAGRVRNLDERLVIREVLQKHIKRVVDPENLFSLHEKTSSVTRDILKEILGTQNESFKNIVWTFNMRRLAVLVSKSFYFKEPVLLVGETGCGKTTVCQILASLRNSHLMCVNCHMHTESSDFLGGLRPVRHHDEDGRLFEWVDGPLIDAMKSGQVFLADEISLADDSVLERLNSLLEPERQILLSEKGLNADDNSSHIVVAIDEFRFIGTMNPGGDYGKKELSPALRNRFTEIWCDSTSSREDLYCVLQKSLNENLISKNSKDICNCILDFVEWLNISKNGERFSCSIRDLLSWVYFINETTSDGRIDLCEAYLHGASLVFLDSFGTSILSPDNVSELKDMKYEAVQFLTNQMIELNEHKVKDYKKLLLNTGVELVAQKSNEKFGIEPFFISCSDNSSQDSVDIESDSVTQFNFMAPTTGINTLRLLRGLQLRKALLLEGSPGVGKTSLVTALAKISGHKVLRINLSDQTDISDLFGADLPTADGSFTWREGAFLSALKNGDWILLDELNLAPQPVLEGLNACLDHRGEIFIPELSKSFCVKQETKIFACQNPLRQGGARRGLPKSFLNRFTQVYIDTLSPEDLNFIINSQYPSIPQEVLSKMIKFNDKILKDTSDLLWGYKGSPWELNLRDIKRWCDGIMKDYSSVPIFEKDLLQTQKVFKPEKFAKLLYVDRMRTLEDKEHVKQIYDSFFSPDYPMTYEYPAIYITKHQIHVGDTSIKRNISGLNTESNSGQELLILRHQIPALKALIECIQMNWLSILIGPTASGKTSCVQVLSQIIGRNLKILPVTSAMDTADILGGFEQADYNRHLEEVATNIENIIMLSSQKLFLNNQKEHAINILEQLELFKAISQKTSGEEQTMEEETKAFVAKKTQLCKILDMLVFDTENQAKIIEMKETLENLGNQVSKDQSINAGGKFEWVDSLLVKCLVDGSWLLVDNVNLCSSAILDRLNCLLETEGVLTIPERGEQINEIKPHKNFRMFFTMDPKNGEISRAMRNRGVEIYMLGNEDFTNESITDIVPFLDLTALLQSTGLPSKYHNFFIDMHKTMRSFIQTYEKPSQCHLIQASMLTCQQLLRGEDQISAIVNSFSDVYIKPRSSSDFSGISLAENKIEMLNVLLANVKEFSLDHMKVANFNEFSKHTLSCKSLCESSSFERIKQDTYFLNKILCKNASGFDDKIILKLSHLFYNFYRISSHNDLIYRYEFVIHLIKSMKNTINAKLADWCLEININLFIAISQNVKKQYIEYPWDLTLVEELTNLDSKSETNLNLNLYIYFLTLTSRNSDDRHENYFKIIDQSKNIASGSYNDIYVGSTLVKYCFPLLQELEKTIKETLLHQGTKIDHNIWNLLVLLLNWFNRFFKSCNLPLFDKSKENSKLKRIIRKDSIEDLILHYKWLSKYLIKDLSSLCPLNSKIIKLITDIDKSLATSNSPFKAIHKQYSKLIGQPSPYPNDQTFALCSLRNEFIKNSVSNKILARQHQYYNNANLEKHNLHISLFSNIRDSFEFPEEIFSEKLQAFNDETPQNEENVMDDDSVISTGTKSFICNAQLWPAKDFLVQKVANLYHIKLLNEFLEIYTSSQSLKSEGAVSKISTSNNDLMNYFSSVIKGLEYFPLKLYSVFSNSSTDLSTCDENGLSLYKHSSEIWDVMTRYKENSPTSHVNYWLNQTHQIVDVYDNSNEDEYNNYELLPMSFPHMTYFTMKFIVDSEFCNLKKDDIDIKGLSAPLVGWQGQSKELNIFHNLLWKNLCILTSKNFQHLYLDAKVILLNYERMALCLENASINSERKESKGDDVIVTNNGDIRLIVENCIKTIDTEFDVPNKYFTNEMISFKNIFNKCLDESLSLFLQLEEKIENCNLNSDVHEDDVTILLLTGRLWTLFGFCNLMLLTEIGAVDEIKKDQLKLNYLKEDSKTVEFLLDGSLLHNILQGKIPIVENDTKAIISHVDSDDMVPSNVNISGQTYEINKISLHNKLLKCYPHMSYLLESKTTIDDNIKNSIKGNSYRPPEPTYSELVKEYDYFMSSLGSFENILSHYNKMKEACSILNNILTKDQFKSNIKKDVNFANDIIKAYSIWNYSVKNFYKKISDKFSQIFPDLVIPFLNGVTQLCYGFDILKNCVKKQLTQLKYKQDNHLFLRSEVENLIRFPIINEKCQNALQLVDTFSSKRFIDLLNEPMNSGNASNTELFKSECYRLLKVNYQELYSKFISNGSIENIVWDCFISVLSEFVTTWQKQCDALEKKKQDDDSIYVTKVKCDEPSEEDQIEEEVKEMFPSYTDSDFNDFKAFSLQPKPNKLPQLNNKINEDVTLLITPKDINFIVHVHSNLMKEYTWTEWLPVLKSQTLICDYLTPLLNRYKITANLLDNVCYGLNESFDSKVLPSLLVLVAQSRSFIDGEDYLKINSKLINVDNRKPNFYQNAWVSETRKCLPILEMVKERTNKLLQEWPDFPTLNDIMTVNNRILDFPVTSPIARFLTGLELLRDKIEDWNKNATKTNTMNDLALVVAQQIVTWRKLELAGWKDSLNNSFERLQSEANKWWFHIFTLVDCYILQKPISANDANHAILLAPQFIEAMQSFMEKSPLVEYNKRLDIIYVMHCHATHLTPTPRRDDVISILWNIYKYYSQFSNQIIQKIKEKRVPIEKKLRDFVKICTWERDLSYWAVKDIVDKAHKTLHKHIKEFEGILQNMSSSFFSIDKSTEQINESQGLWDRPKRSSIAPSHFSIDVNLYVISSRMYKKIFNVMDDDFDHDTNTHIDLSCGVLLPKIESLTLKAKTICKNILTKSTYLEMISSLDHFVTQIIETSQYLKLKEVTPSLPKEKQKKQAKEFLQQKRKALSDLFQTLTHIGISYKTGLMENTTRKGDIFNFLLPPVDIESALSYLKHKRCDTLLISQWKGCDSYFQRCIARMRGLNAVLLKPSPDVGMPNIERFKGFTTHLTIITHNQKSKLIKYSKILCYFRQKVTHITELCESDNLTTDQSSLTSQWHELKQTFNTIIMTAEQFNLVLQAIPQKSDDDTNDIAFDDVLLNNTFMKCDTSWNTLVDSIGHILALANKQRDLLNGLVRTLPATFKYSKKIEYGKCDNFTQPQIDIINKSIVTIKDIRNSINDIVSKFDVVNVSNTDKFDLKNPIVDSLVVLNELLEKKLNVLQPSKDSDLNDENMQLVYKNSAEEFMSKVENVVNFILIVIQENYKRNSTVNKCVTKDPDNFVDIKNCDDFPKFFLRGELEDITNNISNLQLHKLCNKLDLLLLKFNDVVEEDVGKCKKQLLRCIPLLEQICLFTQYYITQQVAVHRVSCKMLFVILNTFIELTSKGFCTPAEFSEENGESDAQGKKSGGLGLGDGDGEKDVSEDIENQDQLEDALKPGEEKNNDDKDCKEESKGIEMTDDFESHLQDVENQNEDSDDNSDDEDADKQMGETETGCDKLDQQLWGSDDEADDEEEETNKDKEESGKGKPIDDKQFGAKDDKNNDEDESAENNDKKTKDKQKNDINEMDEPDYDEDHVDPYHGNQKPFPEPEQMDLPDELNLDDENQNSENEDNNDPFEIDAMNDKKAIEEQDQNKESAEKENDGKDSNKTDATEDNKNDSNAEDDNSDIEMDSEKFNDEDNKDDVDDNNDDGDDLNEGDKKDESDDKINPDENDETTNNDINPKNGEIQEEDIPEENLETPKTTEAQPSYDKSSNENNLESVAAETGSKDMTQTNPQIEKEKEPAPFEQSQEQDGDEQEGMGQSELSLDQKGHMGNRKDKPQSSLKENVEKENNRRSEKRNKPGDTEQERALGEVEQPFAKKSKTLNIQNKKDETDENEKEDGAGEDGDQPNVDVYQHIKEAKETDTQIIDAATDEQASKQALPNKPDEDIDNSDHDDDIAMDDTENIDTIEESLEKVEPEKLGQDKSKKSSKHGDLQDEVTGEMGVEVEGENIPTIGVPRGSETTYHTKLDLVHVSGGGYTKSTVSGASIRDSLQNQNIGNSSAEESAAWHSLWGKTSTQAKLLTEKLRLVLEPTGLSRLAGDYRTGKRINMRRVIPYIASHFRKDRIWLRRTKPAKREYHIAVAIDDSSSMCDNQSKELAFESLALVSQALNLLEAGDLAVLSFGEDTKILHSFNDQFSENSGCKILHNLTFKQKKTRIAQMLDFASATFEELCFTNNAPNAKLLLIVSDGRGIFSEGETKVLQTIRRARQQGIFMVYLIVDNPVNETSIMDIRVPLFDPATNALKCIQPYLDSFPFPFYLILRDITTLPSVLSDAMRQWFELAANMDKQ
ncbi:midasin [Arctopsyche grandis]|uniref:midasin n=1 Tax=Arctopsyche grandis TaxID=121162 RepID=UPI00406D8098